MCSEKLRHFVCREAFTCQTRHQAHVKLIWQSSVQSVVLFDMFVDISYAEMCSHSNVIFFNKSISIVWLFLRNAYLMWSKNFNICMILH